MSDDPSSGRVPPRLGPEFDDAEVTLTIAPDGSLRFEISGVPGEGCEQLERVLLAALSGSVEDRERTPEYHQRRKTGVLGGVKAWLGKK
ncbi:MAG: DUF2997 domain-containing protein [Alphaproteobacteria bacterium]|nr:DUF2997 domain-containing protein [Alphaproteobacteria bacterium]